MQNRLLFVARLDVSAAVLHSCLKFVLFFIVKKIREIYVINLSIPNIMLGFHLKKMIQKYNI
jgi:hypothetical protein